MEIATINNNMSFSDLDLKLKEYAKENNVPIIQDEGLSFLEMVIRLYKPKNILEVGTAIGYSAMRMSRVCNSDVYTIERNETMYNEAVKNVNTANMNDKIHIIYKDALEALDDVKDIKFDLVFIDAAKAQYGKFFNMYSSLLQQGGVVVCDNMYFHNLVLDEEHYNEYSRSVRGLVRKLNQFHKELVENNEFDTVIYDIGDGMAVSIKK